MEITEVRVFPVNEERLFQQPSHTPAEVKNIWRQIDKRGGVDALPEASLREVTGITEQALKDTRLTPAERGDFTHRLAEARQTQTQHHKARAATKIKPPVDMSRSNLPMGDAVFGKQPKVPGKSFPGLIRPGGWQNPASISVLSTSLLPSTVIATCMCTSLLPTGS